MRGLRKYLTPFAPDQSGAVSVLYELGGIIVMSVDLMSRDGLNGKVQYSAQDFVIWMQSLEEMIVWSRS